MLPYVQCSQCITARMANPRKTIFLNDIAPYSSCVLRIRTRYGDSYLGITSGITKVVNNNVVEQLTFHIKITARFCRISTSNNCSSPETERVIHNSIVRNCVVPVYTKNVEDVRRKEDQLYFTVENEQYLLEKFSEEKEKQITSFIEEETQPEHS